jgi:hypothetical protein
MADTIREFVASLGFTLDESSQRNFVGALEGATLRAKLLGDAIEAMARTVVNKVGEVATQFEQLFYQSSRVGASASSIRAFEYAVSQLGGTLEGANSSLEDFAKFLRETPGATATVARLLKIPLEDAKDSAKFLLEANERLSHLSPALQARYRETFHLGDYNTSHALQNPAAPGLYGGQLERDAASGITGDAMKRATEFEQAWRGVWARIGTMAEGGESKLFTALTNPMQKFSEWLDNNSGKINDAISRMATSVGALTTAWVDDLAKVQWTEVATTIEDAAKSISNLTDSIVKDLPALQALLGALVGARVGGLFGPIGAMVGAGAGELAPSMIEQERNPNAPHAADTGVRKWWGEHAPSWLGGDAAALSVSGVDDAKAIKQDGVPVSDGNPLAVNVIKINPDASGGGGFFGAIGHAISGAVSGVRHAIGLVGGAPASIRARGAGGAPTGNEADRAKQAYAYWRGQGLSHDQSLAILGNERGENALGSLTVGDNGSAYGQAQWHMDRVADILRNTGIDVRTAGFLDQQKAMRWEMEHGAGGGHVWDALKNAKSREDAIWTMVHGFERSGDQRGDAAIRLGYADRYGKVISDGSGAAAPKISALGQHPPFAWDTASPVWDQFNRSLPVGPVSTDNSSKNVTSTVTNNITVSGTDPQSTAAMVGLHLDRTSNDISRNLQGAFQ